MKMIKASFEFEIKKAGDIIPVEAEVLMPFCDDDKARQHGMARYVPMYIEKNYGIMQRDIPNPCYFNGSKIVEEEMDLSFEGKDILKMSWEELQDVAVVYDILGVPLYKAVSLAEARRTSLMYYMVKTGSTLKEAQKIIDSGNLPSIILGTKKEVKEEVKEKPVATKTFEEVKEDMKSQGIFQEEQPDYSLDDLKVIADKNGIAYSVNIGLATLKRRLEEKELI